MVRTEEDQNNCRSKDILPFIEKAWDLGLNKVDTDEYRDCMSQLNTYPQDVILSAILDATTDCTSDNVLSLCYLLDLLPDSSAVRAQILAKIGQTPQDAPNYCPLVFLAAQVEEKINDDPEMAEKLIDELLYEKREIYTAFINEVVTAACLASAVSQKLAEQAGGEGQKQEQKWAKDNASKIRV